ncbi:FAS-associated death domain protein [Odontesthes bonariensis]|uniref:FAS-associated death domain protein n=1 Tax=Odontesthes bonariensis TaxID=219752 RepID=UPI003F581126
MSAQQFNAVLLDISTQLNADNLDKIKFLVRGVIGKRELEKIESGLKLFLALTERGKLAADDTDYLSDLLRQIQRHDLSDKLQRFGSQFGPVDNDLDDTEKAKLDNATEVIAANLGKNWRKLGRKLHVSDVKLESISKRHPTDLEETAVELLKEWRKSRGAGAQTEELINALRLCQFNLTADKVEERLKNLSY